MVSNDFGASEPPKPGCVGTISRARAASSSSTAAIARFDTNFGVQKRRAADPGRAQSFQCECH